MDLRTASSGLSVTDRRGAVADLSLDLRDTAARGNPARAAVPTSAEDTVFLTVSLAGTRHTYTYGTPDDSLVAEAATAITSEPRASLRAQSRGLAAGAGALLR